MNFTIRNGRVCMPEGIRDGVDVLVADGRILSITEPGGEPAGEIIDASGCYVLPGFIDPHAHGAQLFEFTAGYFRPATGDFDDSDESWQRGLPAYARFSASTGTCGVCPSTWAAPIPQLARVYRFLRDYIDSPANGADGARFIGGNLEGTFINPDMAGAQNPALVLEPGRRSFDAINEAGAIRLVNICPERGDGALDLIRYVAERGLTPGFGHTNATAAQVAEGVARGLRFCVHFTNGPTGGSYKPFNGGGSIEAVLRTRELYAEQILDTYHVNPAYVRDIVARKGVNRIIVVTDQMFATGSEEVTSFEIGGIRGALSDDGRYVRVADKPNTLFSSVLTMDVAFGNLLSLLTCEMEGVWHGRHEAMPLDAAIAATARMCSTNAAQMMGIGNDSGSVSEGSRADLVIGRIDGEPGRHTFTVEKTCVAGRIAHSR